MSAEKKAQTRADRDEKRRQEEQKDRRSMTVYTVVAVLVVVAAIAAMFWRSGVLQRSMTALDVNGTKYTAADLQYYYTSLYSRHANRYDFLPTASVKDQVYDQETGQSWHDYLLDQAVEQLANNTALAARASSEGYALSQEAQTDLDATLAQLNSSWISGYASRDAFIRANFGSHMTYDRLVTLLNLEFLASDYADSRLAAITHPDTDYEGYYQDNAGSLDTYVYTLLTFQASVPTTDGQGNPVTMTDGEKAAAYMDVMGQPSDEYVEGVVSQQMENMTRQSIEEMIIQQYAGEMGVDADTVSGYIAEMDDETLFARIEEAIAQQVREQYAQGVQASWGHEPGAAGGNAVSCHGERLYVGPCRTL